MGARFRKVDPRTWKDEKFIKLDEPEKLLVFYCITGPQTNRIGLYNFSPGEAAEDLGTLPQTFQERFKKVCERLRWTFDFDYRILYIPTWWKYNKPENPNVLKACLEDLHDLPQTELIEAFAENLVYLPETFHQTFREGLDKPYPKQSPKQEQEQEQELKTITAFPTDRNADEKKNDEFILTRRGRKLKGVQLIWFNEFWEAFEYKKGRAEAADAFLDIKGLNKNMKEQIVHAAKIESCARLKVIKRGGTPKMAQGWLTGRRWEDKDIQPQEKTWRDEIPNV